MVNVTLQHVPCLGCGTKLKIAEPRARSLPTYGGEKAVFCSIKCNRAFVAREGAAQQEILRETTE
jgi:hypothetical protein